MNGRRLALRIPGDTLLSDRCRTGGSFARNMKRAIAIIAFIIAALALGVSYQVFIHTPKDFRPVDVAAHESDMTAAVLADLFRMVKTNDVEVVFLAFGHRLTPPTDAFISRFSSHQPPVRSVAESKVSPTGAIVERGSGKAGAIVQIATIQKKSAAESDVEVALSSLPPNSNRFLYTVARENGTWKVKNSKPYGVK